MMKCAGCGHKNKEEGNYCARCGMPMNGMVEREASFHGEDFQEERPAEEEADWIFDRDEVPVRKRNFLVRMLLVAVLLAVAVGAFQAMGFAVNTNDRRQEQAELMLAQQKEAEELKRIEAYRERFNVVLESYEIQGGVIEENLQNFTKLRINRFAEGLRLGSGFNALVDRIFDVSGVEDMKGSSTTLNLLVQELLDPPNTFESKFEDLLALQELENEIVRLFQGEMTSKVKEDLTQQMGTYWILLTDLKR